MNQVTNMLMNQLKIRNPQAFKQVQELRKTNGNPKELLQQVMGKYTPEQLNKFTQLANTMGISNEQLNQIGINYNKS